MDNFLHSSLPLIITSLIFLIGLVGCFVPIIPGSLLIFGGILLHKLWAAGPTISWVFVIIVGVITLFILVADYLLAYLGAKRFGATWKGGLGAFIGAVAGPFLLSPLLGIGILLGIIIGPILGAIIGELWGGNHLQGAAKAGFGTIVGGMASLIMKLVLSFFMISYFYLVIFKFL